MAVRILIILTSLSMFQNSEQPPAEPSEENSEPTAASTSSPQPTPTRFLSPARQRKLGLPKGMDLRNSDVWQSAWYYIISSHLFLPCALPAKLKSAHYQSPQTRQKSPLVVVYFTLYTQFVYSICWCKMDMVCIICATIDIYIYIQIQSL